MNYNVAIPPNTPCPLCFDPLSEDVVSHQGNGALHPAHKQCIREWVVINPTCPSCRVPVNASSLGDEPKYEQIKIIGAIFLSCCIIGAYVGHETVNALLGHPIGRMRQFVDLTMYLGVITGFIAGIFLSACPSNENREKISAGLGLIVCSALSASYLWLRLHPNPYHQEHFS